MKKIFTAALAFFMGMSAACSQTNMENYKAEDPKDAIVELKTTMGDVVVELFNDTPLHRDNFLKLVKEGYYDGVLFHRVINDFMVQTGDPNSKNAPAGASLGSGDPGYTIPAEIVYPGHYHKYGALAAARTGDEMNPERRSSGSQFYIVTGNKFSERQLENMDAKRINSQLQDYFRNLAMSYRDSIQSMQKRGDAEGLEALRQKLIKETEEAVNPQEMSEAMRQVYVTQGGTPHLDGGYSVFGQVLKGMDIVDKIQKVETDAADRPLEDVKIISAEVIKEPSV